LASHSTKDVYLSALVKTPTDAAEAVGVAADEDRAANQIGEDAVLALGGAVEPVPEGFN
jgi:hypothetical protein